MPSRTFPSLRLLLLLLLTLCAKTIGQQKDLTSFSLINTLTNEVVRLIQSGDKINLAESGSSLSIRADTTESVASVTFAYSFIQRADGESPFTLGGEDGAGNIEPVSYLTASTGNKQITIIAHDASANVLAQETLQLTVIDSSLATAPTISPDLTGTTAPSTSPVVQNDVSKFESSPEGVLNGELFKWHRLTLCFTGRLTNERNNFPHTFTDLKFDVTFTHVGRTEANGTIVTEATGTNKKSYLVPGYYAATGDAANTGSTGGSVWCCHFTPDETGWWEWESSFIVGERAVFTGVGERTFFDGKTGSFEIEPTNKSGRDLRGKGRLQYVGAHHLRFAETGEYFLKAGSDSPENFLAYDDFDGTPNNGDRRKSWAPHAKDYVTGDPTWQGGRGTEIIGAVNYLSAKGMNAISFLTMNIEGDDENVFPYTEPDQRMRFDVSKLDQWEIVFHHCDRMGVFLHFKLQETENDQLLDGGALRDERKLYFREMISRFGHHLALNWNLGEENTNTDAERKAFSDYIKAVDPYNSPIVIHTFPNQALKDEVYTPLLGHTTLDGASLQSPPATVFTDTLKWVNASAAAGHKWVVCNDEQNPAGKGVLPDSKDPNHNVIRKNVLWGNIMAGGAGVEYYFGYNYNNSDLTLQDFRSREIIWEQSFYALSFFSENAIPFWRMSNANADVSNSYWVMKDDSNSTYVIYLYSGGTVDVDMSGNEEVTYKLQWYNPRRGGQLESTGLTSVQGGSSVSLGPTPQGGDWIALLECESCATISQNPEPEPNISPITTLPSSSPSISPTVAPSRAKVLPQSELPTIAASSQPSSQSSDPMGNPSERSRIPSNSPSIALLPTVSTILPTLADPSNPPFTSPNSFTAAPVFSSTEEIEEKETSESPKKIKSATALTSAVLCATVLL